jgi:energy-coupling factor transporter ATP-binding protein EcfA2
MLTVKEHLLFYARVKGVAPSEEEAAVGAMLRRIGLSEFANRQAEALSGGMRRRLSCGNAMIGPNIKVVLLDELTTGLDPASRRAVWRVVDGARRATPGALFLLISHDMAEVEALCSGGAAIMTHGRVRCTGSVQHLRQRYSGGVLLRVAFRGERLMAEAEAAELQVGAILAPAEELAAAAAAAEEGSTEAWAAAKACILQLFPAGSGSAALDGAVFQTRQVLPVAGQPGTCAVAEAGSATFLLRLGSPSVAGAECSVAAAFRSLRSKASAGGIVSWALEAQTLDSVFARVVRHFKA